PRPPLHPREDRAGAGADRAAPLPGGAARAASGAGRAPAHVPGELDGAPPAAGRAAPRRDPGQEPVVRRVALLLLGLLPAAVGYGLWRVERDRPLWLRPALWAAARPRAAAAGLPRLVLAFHYPWYGTPAGPTGRWRHWNHPRVAGPAERILGFHDPRREAAPGRLELGAT